MLGRHGNPPQPRLLRLDVDRKMSNGTARRAELFADVCAITTAACNLRSKGIGCDRRPDRCGCGLHEVGAGEVYLIGALLELTPDCVEMVGHPQTPFAADAGATTGVTNVRGIGNDMVGVAPARGYATSLWKTDSYEPAVEGAAAAFAAAFISRLCARTFCNDSGPVTSATERWLPSMP
ncbi:MAG: hypothetical protein QOJ62_1561 [Actinomycetota bacterium]|nr:hypothetical protein [Actinomycetota bacterium]